MCMGPFPRCSTTKALLISGDTEYPLAGLPIQHVLGVPHFREAQNQERSSFILPRLVMTSE